jgi:outer membrane protein
MGYKIPMITRASTFLLTFMLCSTIEAQQPPKIGVVNVQKALASTKEGQKATQDLQAKVEPKQKQFNARQQEITELESQLNRGAILSDDKKAQLTRDLDEKKRTFQRDTQDADEELRGEQQEVLQRLGQRLMAVVNKYAKDNGYTLILAAGDTTPVIYSADSNDVTPTVVALYDKTYANQAAPAPAVPKP